MLRLKLQQLLIFAEQIGVDLGRFPRYVLSCGLLLPQLGEHRIFLSLESVELRPQFLIELSLIPKILLQILIDYILDLAHFVKFSFQIIRKSLLIPQLARDIALLMRCLFQLGEHEV